MVWRKVGVLEVLRRIDYDERRQVLQKANILLKRDIDFVVSFWRRFADPLRGTVVPVGDSVMLISHVESDIVHVSDIVRAIIYGEVSDVLIVDEKRFRLMARGILYQYLFRLRFGSRIKAVFELPIAWPINDVLVLGTVDMLVPIDDSFFIVELKSSSSPKTVSFGVLQVKMYWCLLSHFYNLRVAGAAVSTPKRDIVVSEPLRPRELRRLVKMYLAIRNRLLPSSYS